MKCIITKAMKTFTLDFKRSTAVLVVVALVASCLLPGCREENPSGSTEKLPYLSVGPGDISTWSKEELETMASAFERITVLKEEGVFRIKQSSGKEVNISEELFNFFQTMTDNSNELLKRAIKRAPSLPPLAPGDFYIR
jgi:hypothetical protein